MSILHRSVVFFCAERKFNRLCFFLPLLEIRTEEKKSLFIIFPRMQFPVKAPPPPPFLFFSVHPSCQGGFPLPSSSSPLSLLFFTVVLLRQAISYGERKEGRVGGEGPRERKRGRKHPSPSSFSSFPSISSSQTAFLSLRREGKEEEEGGGGRCPLPLLPPWQAGGGGLSVALVSLEEGGGSGKD